MNVSAEFLMFLPRFIGLALFSKYLFLMEVFFQFSVVPFVQVCFIIGFRFVFMEAMRLCSIATLLEKSGMETTRAEAIPSVDSLD